MDRRAARRAIDVLLADDHPSVRAGIRAILERAPDLRVVGEAADGAEARRLVAALRPQVLLLDLRMPGPPPEKTVAWVRARYPKTVVLVLTAYDLDAYLARMLAAGAAGYLVKGVAPERLVAAVRRVARGEVIFGKRQLARARRWQREVGDR
ncbi:MAG TPA: response regulator transcription factor [Chloroflexi bacterium]|jgi:DNA-binding NarL/FixJ family response regulator|nr:response regulator transcription factor [Chloroflexota bacterium]